MDLVRTEIEECNILDAKRMFVINLELMSSNLFRTISLPFYTYWGNKGRIL